MVEIVDQRTRQKLVKELAKDFEDLSLKALDKRKGILLVGSEENVQKASELIVTRLNAGSSSPLASENISIPRSLHGAIVGRGGETVRRIRKDTGCEIRIPPPFMNVDEIELSGTAEAIVQAKAAIQQVTSDKSV